MSIEDEIKPYFIENRIECPERQDVVDGAIIELKTAFQTLGIESLELPEVKIKFVESEGEPVLGHVEVHGDSIEIAFDQKFSSSESEAVLVEELHKSGKDYPGMQQTLKHELAHVAMWSVTGLQRQPATRLIDEGWASLVENTGQQLPTKQSKSVVRQGLIEEPELYKRCLDFSKPVTFEEKLNASEYMTGQALLLWVHGKFGREKMVELIKKSTLPEKRNDDLPEVKATKQTIELEGRQFEAALLEVTGFQSLDEVRQEFLKWISVEEKSSESPQESKIYQRARVGLSAIFEQFENPNERLAEIMKKIEPFFEFVDKKILPYEKIEEIRKALGPCASIQDKKQFLDAVMKALKPALDVREAHADKFEEAQAKAMNEAGGFTEINRLFSYGKSGPIIHIHAPAGETVGRKTSLYREGMRKLAEIVNDDPEVQKITATSPLVAEHPGLFTKAGFQVEDVTEEFKKEHFPAEERDVKIATIDREEFLKRFLKEK